MTGRLRGQDVVEGVAVDESASRDGLMDAGAKVAQRTEAVGAPSAAHQDSGIAILASRAGAKDEIVGPPVEVGDRELLALGRERAVARVEGKSQTRRKREGSRAVAGAERDPEGVENGEVDLRVTVDIEKRRRPGGRGGNGLHPGK